MLDPDPAFPTPPPGDPDSAATRVLEAPALAMAYHAGERLGNHRITGILGRGGMGIVYEAIDTQLARKVAIKMLGEGLAGSSSAGRFFQEARAAARLTHPNVVSIFEMGQRLGMCYLVLELIEGGSLADALKAGPLPWKEATRLVADACRGLAAAHEAGMIHRDIKPANILRSRDGVAKITDFGLAKLVEGLGASLTAAGRVVGTPAYMSPEQCHSMPVDHRTDIYSLGATYYALLTGEGPYGGSSSTPQLMFAHCYKPVPDPRMVAPKLPEGCAAVVRRAMAKAREDRYPGALEMLDDLEALLAGATPAAQSRLASPRPRSSSAAPESPASLEKPAGPGMSRRAWLTLAGSGVAAICGGFAIHRGGGSRNGGAVGLPIRVGLLHSLTGPLAQSESTALDGAMLAIDELNRAGGLLGRAIVPVVADGQSDPATFSLEAERLIRDEHVCVLFGCWTAASRKAVKPVVEQYRHLLIYPLQNEGLEESPNIIYTGATPNQQVLPAVKWCFTDLGRAFFLVGSDDLFPRVAHEIARDEIQRLGGSVVGERYLTLGTTDVAGAVEAIRQARPAVVLNTISGDTNLPFFRALRDAGITPEAVPTMSFSLTENEVRALGPRRLAGDFAAGNYFESLDNPANRSFVERFQSRFGPQRQSSDPTEAAYLGVHLWALALTAAGREGPGAVRNALAGRRFEAPEGLVRIDPENGHAWKTTRIGRIQPDGSFELIWSSTRPIRPEPFPLGRSRADWQRLLDEMRRQWGGRWQPPTIA